MARLPAGAVLVRRLVLVCVEWPWPSEPDPAARLRAASAVGRGGGPGLPVRRATAPRWLLDRHRAVPVGRKHVHSARNGIVGAARVAEPSVADRLCRGGRVARRRRADPVRGDRTDRTCVALLCASVVRRAADRLGHIRVRAAGGRLRALVRIGLWADRGDRVRRILPLWPCLDIRRLLDLAGASRPALPLFSGAVIAAARPELLHMDEVEYTEVPRASIRAQ